MTSQKGAQLAFYTCLLLTRYFFAKPRKQELYYFDRQIANLVMIFLDAIEEARNLLFPTTSKLVCYILQDTHQSLIG